MATQSPPLSSGEQIDDIPPPPPTLSSSSSSDSQRLFLPTPFLSKTYLFVDDISSDAIVSWNGDGTAFVVWSPVEFARDVLPKHFKHNNFSSFVRQHTYGFRKLIPDRWEFSNDCFRSVDKRLLCDIVRRKLAAAVPGGSRISIVSIAAASMKLSTRSSVVPAALLFVDQSECDGTSSSSWAHLMDENDRLKKKNTQLYKELSRMKSMCTNIYSMMSNYNPGAGPVPGLRQGPGPPPPMLGAVGCGSNNSSRAESMMIPLHVMSGQRLLAMVVETQAVKAATIADEHLSLNPSVFGYGSKRARDEESSGERVEQDDLLQLQQPR